MIAIQSQTNYRFINLCTPANDYCCVYWLIRVNYIQPDCWYRYVTSISDTFYGPVFRP